MKTKITRTGRDKSASEGREKRRKERRGNGSEGYETSPVANLHSSVTMWSRVLARHVCLRNMESIRRTLSMFNRTTSLTNTPKRATAGELAVAGGLAVAARNDVAPPIEPGPSFRKSRWAAKLPACQKSGLGPTNPCSCTPSRP